MNFQTLPTIIKQNYRVPLAYKSSYLLIYGPALSFFITKIFILVHNIIGWYYFTIIQSVAMLPILSHFYKKN